MIAHVMWDRLLVLQMHDSFTGRGHAWHSFKSRTVAIDGSEFHRQCSAIYSFCYTRRNALGAACVSPICLRALITSAVCVHDCVLCCLQ